VAVTGWGLLVVGAAGIVVQGVLGGAPEEAVLSALFLVTGLGVRRCRVLVDDAGAEVVNLLGRHHVARGEVVGVDTASTGSVALRVRLHLDDGRIVPLSAASGVPGSLVRARRRSATRALESAFAAWAGVSSGVTTRVLPARGDGVAPRVGAAEGVRRLGDGRVLIREPLLRFLAGVVALGVLPLVVQLLSDVRWVDPVDPFAFALLAAGLVAVLVTSGLWRTRVELTADEARVVNLWRTRLVPRDAVVDVTWSSAIVRGGAVLRLERTDGRSVSLAATYAPMRSVRGERSPQAALEVALRAWVATGALPGE
jgi:hypothetical protein